MARLNTTAKSAPVFTHEGARAVSHLTPLQQLRRSTLSCLLWEREFYEDGASIADRIEQYAQQVPLNDLASLALEARSKFHLRHLPLLLLCSLIEQGRGHESGGVSKTISDVIQRADEITELLAIYWRKGKRPLSAQMKKGLSAAFSKFDEHALAKYDRDGIVKLRDVLRLCHAKPADKEREALYRRVLDRTLQTPDTWEVALSGGADKGETFTRLLKEGNLGYLALLRNLRNMVQANVDHQLIRTAIRERKNGAHRVLPFRYVAAARAAPMFEKDLNTSMLVSLGDLPAFDGRTVVLVDVSNSMNAPLSARSDLKRMDAAAALASIITTHDEVRVFTFSSKVMEVPHRLGMAGVDTILGSQPHQSTLLGEAITRANEVGYDRLIVISDEQAGDHVTPPLSGSNSYMINVGSYQNGVGYGQGWTANITGFSENVLRYIHEMEAFG